MIQSYGLNPKTLTNGELADILHELNNELDERCCNLGDGSWLFKQLEAARLRKRSLGSQAQKNWDRMEGQI